MRILSLLILNCICLFSFAQTELNLQSTVSYNDNINDVWGYADGAREYALVGVQTGLSIVDVTVPTMAVELQFIPHVNTTWRDIKTFDHYAYVTNESADGLLIIDLSTLPNYANFWFWTGEDQNYIYDGDPYIFNDAHNIFIDEFGYAYLCGGNVPGGGALILDLNTDAENPEIAGHYDLSYCHDIYVRDNLMYTSEIYNGWFGIVDVSDKTNIGTAQFLGSNLTPNEFTHNAWLSDDGNTLYTTDERSGAYVAAYDVSDPTDIVPRDRYQAVPGGEVIPHNTHVLNDFLITSYYTSGVTVVDATDPDVLVEVAYHDTSPASGNGFSGCWGAFPFLPSGNILATDRQEGLFVLGNNYIAAAKIKGYITDASTGSAINDAAVTFSPNVGMDHFSNVDGFYGNGTTQPGSYNMTITAAGYESETVAINLVNGQTVIQDIQLNSLGGYSFFGNIVDGSNGNALGETQVMFTDGNGESIITESDFAGNFNISLIQGTDYEVYAAEWGYLPTLISGTDVESLNGNFTVELNPGYCDDFSLDLGWFTITGPYGGEWERGEPIGTDFYQNFANPEEDVNTDIGNACYITGNGGGSAGFDDVDGLQVLVSPWFDLSSYNDPVISYDRWFFNNSVNGNQNDSMIIRLQYANNTFLEFEKLYAGNSSSEWLSNEVRLLDFLNPWNLENLRMEVRIYDTETDPHIVEGGFDNFKALDACAPGEITGLPSSTSSSVPITLTANPPGGSFSGPGVILSAFNPSLAGPGNHEIIYTFDDGLGCSGEASQNILVVNLTYNFVNYNLGTISPE